MNATMNNPARPIRADEIDRSKFDNFLLAAKGEQNLILGFLAGLAAVAIAAVIWALITVFTKYQIGWMAIGVGYLVGIAIRQFGKGMDKSFGVMGGAGACRLPVGQFTELWITISQQRAISLIIVFLAFLTSPLPIEILEATFSPLDLLFCGRCISRLQVLIPSNHGCRTGKSEESGTKLVFSWTTSTGVHFCPPVLFSSPLRYNREHHLIQTGRDS